ncbi:MAG: Peptidase [Bradyrhizobium sp.]|nr:Peptidase [Bradyrhizobium sp.]
MPAVPDNLFQVLIDFLDGQPATIRDGLIDQCLMYMTGSRAFDREAPGPRIDLLISYLARGKHYEMWSKCAMLSGLMEVLLIPTVFDTAENYAELEEETGDGFFEVEKLRAPLVAAHRAKAAKDFAALRSTTLRPAAFREWSALLRWKSLQGEPIP